MVKGDPAGEIPLAAHHDAGIARLLESREGFLDEVPRDRGENPEAHQKLARGSHEKRHGARVAARRPEQDVTADEGLRGEVLEHLRDVEGGGLPGQDALHPRVRAVPEAASLPELEQAVEAGEELSHLAAFGVDVLVEPEAREFLLIGARPVRRLVAIGLDRGVQGIKPLGKRLPPASGDLLEALRTRHAPGLEVVEALLGHEQLEVIEQYVQIVVKHVIAAKRNLVAADPQRGLGDDAELTHAAAHRVKQLAVPFSGATYDLACAGHDFEL